MKYKVESDRLYSLRHMYEPMHNVYIDLVALSRRSNFLDGNESQYLRPQHK